MAPRKKLDVSFEEIVSAPVPVSLNPEVSKTLNQDDVLTQKSYDVVTLKRDIKRSHVSLYVSQSVQKAVKQIALDRNLRAHDLYIDGLRTMLKAHGLDFDKLNAS